MKKTFAFWGLFIVIIMSLISCSQDKDIIITEDNIERTSPTISLAEAEADLNKLLDDIYNMQSTRTSNSKRKVISNAFTIENVSTNTRADGTTPITVHVFNFEDQEGFALMAGNSELPSLLALADSGEITETAQIDNPGVAIFLENMEQVYIDELSTSISTGTSSNYKIYGEWENIVYKQGGYCTVKWDQVDPYNKFCPEKDGENCVTGCVATAVAQFMSISRYPSSYNRYTFDWDKMTYSPYASLCTTEGTDQIARLMSELGKKSNLDMSYNTSANGGSGANAENIPRTLKNFGYSSGGSLGEYNTEKVVSELKNGYSILVGGFSHKTVKKFLGITVSTKYSGGHRWLCHGLLERRRTVKTYNSNGVLQSSTTESEWYPLCNWGWSGYHDGYYLSKAFNSNNAPSYPTSTRSYELENGAEDYNYQYKITTVTGIRK